MESEINSHNSSMSVSIDYDQNMLLKKQQIWNKFFLTR